MSQPPVVQLDSATATYDELVELASISIATWPSPNASAEGSARHALSHQHKHTPGQNLHYVIRDGRPILAHAHCFPREIVIEGERLIIWALAGVCTRAEHRKKGLGAAVVRACFAHVGRGEYPWCLYQTKQPNRAFYESLGAATLTNRFFNSLADPPDPNPWWDNVQMAYPATRPFPAGVVDLLGPAY